MSLLSVLYIAYIVFYIAIVFCIAWSAVKHRREGWVSGLILAVLLATIPLWAAGAMHLFVALAPEPPENWQQK